MAGKSVELADGLVQQAGAVLPDELHAGPNEEQAQKPAVAGSIMKAQIPKLNLVQVACSKPACKCEADKQLASKGIGAMPSSDSELVPCA